jgi:hypothetical protein
LLYSSNSSEEYKDDNNQIYQEQNMKRREFPGTVASASAILAIGSTAGPAERTASAATKKPIENESKGHTLLILMGRLSGTT